MSELIVISKEKVAAAIEDRDEMRSKVDELEAELKEAKADSKRLDKLDAFEPSCLLDLIELHCVKEDKTVRQMVDWIYRNVEEQD